MHLLEVMRMHGPMVVFACALASQAGLPIPAGPAMIVGGALAAAGEMRAEVVWLAAVVAALIADHGWYVAGRLQGRRMLGLLCRISLSPDTCVRQADSLFARMGGPILVVAKLVPGVAAVSIPTAAASGLRYSRFLLYDGAGAGLWAALWVGTGVIFSREVDRVLDWLAASGAKVTWILAAALAAWIGAKWWERVRLRRLYRGARIDAEEVASRIAAGEDLVILDARSELAWESDARRLPNARRLETLEGAVASAEPYRGWTIVTFCTCPNEASAAVVAKRLIDAGHADVRVLAGGEDALARLA